MGQSRGMDGRKDWPTLAEAGGSMSRGQGKGSKWAFCRWKGDGKIMVCERRWEREELMPSDVETRFGH